MSSIMVINAKGGSGKTTISTNLASYYASSGFKVTLVDLDPQGSGSPREESPAGPGQYLLPAMHQVAMQGGGQPRIY